MKVVAIIHWLGKLASRPTVLRATACAVLALLCSVALLQIEAFPGHRTIHAALIGRLRRAVPKPAEDVPASSVIYVAGGSIPSLIQRFNMAAALYKAGIARTILIDSDQMHLEYDPSVGRNRMFNEWAIETLGSQGVRKADIYPVELERGFFGTFQEAKGILGLVRAKGYEALILVTSSYHTERTWMSFASQLEDDRRVRLYVYPANDRPDTVTLLTEYVKLRTYEILLF